MASTRAGFELGSMTYQQDSGAYRYEYDQDTTPASMAVIAALSDVVDTDPTDLKPLNDTVDTDALDAIVGVRHGTEGGTHVTFTHEGHAVTVSSDGGVTISEGHDPSAEHSGRDAAK